MELTIYDYNIGEDNSFIIDYYVDYFMANIQTKIVVDGKTLLEGERAADLFYKDISESILKTPELHEWLNNEKLADFHRQLQKSGMELCPLNLFVLCKYILTIIRKQYIVLLKPTIKDTLEELNEVQAITFTNKDGRQISTRHTGLIKKALSGIMSNEDEEYEALKWDKVENFTDKTNLLSSFCYYMALFLQTFFADYPRRKNCCMVSRLEQELILYMICFWELSAEPLTLARFRQLISHYGKYRERVSLCRLPDVGLVPIEFVKYKDWRKGNIKLDKIDSLKSGEVVKFPDSW